MKWMLLMLVVMMSGVAEARLGETHTDVAKRYGPVQARETLSTNEWSGTYTFKTYHMMVVFSNNVSVVELVRPVEKRKFGVDERESLMKTIGGEGEWIKATESEGSKLGLMQTGWMKAKTNLIAVLDERNGHDSMIITSVGYAKTAGALLRQKERRKTQHNRVHKPTIAGSP